MKLFENVRDALKIAKKIKEIKKFLKENHLTDDIKNDISIIKEGVKRLGAKIPAIKDLFDLIF